jgi:SAM-dependent methyltransferase
VSVNDHFRSAVERVEQAAIQRYNDRLARFGEDPRTLGWDTRDHQWTRFAAVTAIESLDGRDVLDIGCGLADFRAFLSERGVAPRAYKGIDINPSLIEVAGRRFPGDRFEVRSILREPFPAPVCDVGVMLGLVNFRLSDIDNYDYAREAMTAAFAACREALVVDMLSARTVESYPREDVVFYFEPLRILELALSLTPWVKMHHAYAPLPQREFMIVLRRCPTV